MPPKSVRRKETSVLEAHFSASLSPNLAEGRLVVELGLPVSQVRSTTISSAARTILRVNSHRVVSDKQLGFEVSTLKAGLYLLTLDTQSGTKVLKFFKK